MKHLVEPLVMTFAIGAPWILVNIIENEPIQTSEFLQGMAFVVLAQAVLLAYRMVRRKKTQQPHDE